VMWATCARARTRKTIWITISHARAIEATCTARPQFSGRHRRCFD